MRINPAETEPRLSWNRPPLDPGLYFDQGPSLLILERAEEEISKEELVFAQALSVLEREYATPDFSIDDLSREVGFSTRQLQRIFKNQGSAGFRAEVRKIRVAQAQRQLRFTDKSLEQIARETGYKQPSHFSRVFTKEVGQTPSQYRKVNRRELVS